MTAIILGVRTTAGEELDHRVARAAGALAGLGLRSGDLFAVLMRNDQTLAELIQAAQRIGAGVVPVNWHFKSEEAAHVLSDSGAKLLIGHADLLSGVEEAASMLPAYAVATPPELLRAFGLDPRFGRPPDADCDWEARVACAAPWTAAPGPAPQTIFYTSGTTGKPKGVVRPAAGVEEQKKIAATMACVFGSRPGMRTLAAAPLYHGAPNAMAVSTLRSGGTLVIQPRFDPEGFLDLVERHRISHVFMVPTMFVRLLRLPRAVREGRDLSSLERVLHGAAPCPPEIKRRMIEWLGPVVWEYYASTELGPIACISSGEWLERPGSVGRAVPGAVIRVYGEQGPLGAGQTGDIYCRQTHYPDFTYRGQPAQRCEVERDGLATCGDMGYLDEAGYLYLCDRRRDMVISGGVNVYPAEIEGVLVTMPGVQDAAVFGVPDPEYGESLAACIQPLPGHALSADAVRAFVRERLAAYKVPRLVEFRDSLPREESGKIFKRKLRDPYWRGPAGHAHPEDSR